MGDGAQQQVKLYLDHDISYRIAEYMFYSLRRAKCPKSLP
jgi:hypothetical protein